MLPDLSDTCFLPCGRSGARIPATTQVPSLFYIRLISLTAGTLVYLFLLALILGHRRPRYFERLLFFLVLSLFLIYAGALLEMNARIEYVSPPSLTIVFAQGLIALGSIFLLPLVWHTFFKYYEQVRHGRVSPIALPIIWIFYLIPLLLINGMIVFGYEPHAPLTLAEAVKFLAEEAPGGLALCATSAAFLGFAGTRSAANVTERQLFRWVFLSSCFLASILALQNLPWKLVQLNSDAFLTAAALGGVLPGAALLYYAVRRNFLEYGAQRNLMYALPATFLALLYLALVRRVSGWLEPVLPPEATASVLLFILIFLFEPLERVIGPVLHRQLSER